MNLVDRLKSFLHLSWIFATRVISEKQRWKTVEKIKEKHPRVFYGHDRIPPRTDKSGGGTIKLQDLCDIFPNTTRGANLLYLVSSAMPPFPVVMVGEAKRHGAVFILNQNGVAYPGWHGPGWKKTNRPMRLLFERADYVIYQSEFCKKSADIFLGRCQSPCTILHNPVDTRIFVPALCKPQGFRLLLAGSHEHFYRVRTALEMMPHLRNIIPEATLTVAGRYSWKKSEKECMEEARQIVGKFGISENVVFQGGYSQVEAPALFQQHHVLLHTKYNDPCPRLVTEAMACGLPVVFSASGGVPELVEDTAGVGVLAPLDWERDHPPAPEALAQAVVQVWGSYERFAAAARNRAVKYFDVRPWIAKHNTIFLDLLKNKKHRVA